MAHITSSTRSLLAASTLAALVGLCASAARADTTDRPDGTADAVRIASELSKAFRAATAAVKPSVVSIRAEQTPGPRGPALSEGSGIVARADGFIVTNNHVVDGSRSITIHLPDGRDLPGTIVGADPETDLAVVKIDATGLTAATFGNSDEMQPGDWVVAVGSPFGLRETVTAGIVSAIGRSDVGVGKYENFIQTDTSINPGNSGGPLVNLQGQVIGLNTAIRTAGAGGGGSNGIAFAIPSSTVSRISDMLIANGHVDRGWLGIGIQPLTQDLATSLNVSADSGVLVSDVTPDSPAARSGLRSGDTIISINDTAVKSPRGFNTTIATMPPGTQVTLSVLRDGSATTISAALSARPRELGMAAEDGSTISMGLGLQPLVPELARLLNIPDHTGVVVNDISPDSPAAKAGLRHGDVIVKVADKPVESTDSLRSAWEATAKGKQLLLTIRRGSTSLVILPEKQD